MRLFNTKLVGAALIALISLIGTVEAQLILVTNGDFETAAGADWDFAGGGATIDFAATGGSGGGGFADMDSTGGWGVLVSDNGVQEPIGTYFLTPGTTYDFSFDMKGFNGGEVAGIKIESWNAGSVISDSGDIKFTTTDTWANYIASYTLTSDATHIKFVPVSVDGGRVGFDNIGVINPAAVPEPGSLCVIALGVIGLVSRRRRI